MTRKIKNYENIYDIINVARSCMKYTLTDTGEDSKLSHRRKRSKVNAAPPRYFLLLFRRIRATSMTQRRVENTRVHF